MYSHHRMNVRIPPGQFPTCGKLSLCWENCPCFDGKVISYYWLLTTHKGKGLDTILIFFFKLALSHYYHYYHYYHYHQFGPNNRKKKNQNRGSDWGRLLPPVWIFFCFCFFYPSLTTSDNPLAIPDTV